MTGIWHTPKVTGQGPNAWAESGVGKGVRASGAGVSATPLFAPLQVSSYRNDVLISDMGAWSGFERPDKTFADCWQDEGGLPEVASAAIENTDRFVGFEVVLGLSDPSTSGITALLRINGHLTVLCVVDMQRSGDAAMMVDVERARELTCKRAHEYCVDDAILLFHAGARRMRFDLKKALAPLGIPRAEASVLYPCGTSELAALSVGWIHP